MAEIYEDIVRKYYMKFRGNFINFIMTKYKGSKLRAEDAENIYQDVFLAIQENLMLGRIKENTSWQNYIWTVGLNMANKLYRKIDMVDSYDQPGGDGEDEDAQSAIARKVDELVKSMAETGPDLVGDPSAQAVLGDELTHTPEPCATIIRLTYFGGCSDAEIVEEFDRYNSKDAVKSKRYQCMKDLIYRVKMGLYNAGILAVKPQKK